MGHIARAGSFIAVDEAGSEYTIYVFEELVPDIAPGSDSVAKRKLFRTSDGQTVVYLSQGQYDILTPRGAILATSSSATAP